MNKSSLTHREMYGQPAAFKGVNDSLADVYEVLDTVFREGTRYDELLFTGCGTSLYIAQSAAHAFSAYTDIPARAVPCSELYFFTETYVKGDSVLVLPITRKGYTTEVRMAIDKVRTLPSVKTLSITCDPGTREYNDYVILSPEASEESVVMTRSFTSMVYLAIVMAMYAGGKKDEIEAMAKYDTIATEMIKSMDETARKIVYDHPGLDLFVTLGQGVYYGIANECMNKIKEMSIGNSEAYANLEYRHGPMSLADEHTLVLTLANMEMRKYDIALMDQMKGFGAITAAVGVGVTETMPQVDYALDMPDDFNDMQNAALIGIIGQFIGYYLAEKKGIDADTPRNLSQAIVLKG